MNWESDWQNPENLQAFLEKTCAAMSEHPADETSIKMCRKLSQLLSKRHQISRVRDIDIMHHFSNMKLFIYNFRGVLVCRFKEREKSFVVLLLHLI